MRDNRSPSGSFIDIVRVSLPARLQQPGNQPLRAEFAQRNSRQFMLAVISTRPASQLATIANPRCRGVTRQFGEFERGSKSLFDRLGFVARDCLEPRSSARIFFRHPAAAVV